MENGQLLAGYAPGMNQAIWEPGTVKRIPAGSKIVFQLHYSKVVGSEQTDRSSIGLILAKTEPRKLVRTYGISNNAFLIPPGADLEKLRGGPDVTFEGLMPKAGRYRAWTQFRRNDRLHTFAFTFEVAAGQ